MHRLYCEKSSPKLNENGQRKAVFMQHGMLDSSALWVINDPKHAPAFELAR